MAINLSSEKVGFNIRFVRTVEKYPCIYNYQIDEYSNRQHKLEAWQMIATELSSSGITVLQCKEKWRNMRICYTEYIRKFVNDTPEQLNARSYLTEVMKFLRPFIRKRDDYAQTRIASFDADTCSIPDLPNVIRPKLEQSDAAELVISDDEESNGIERMEAKLIYNIKKEGLDILPLADIHNSSELPDLCNSGTAELLNPNPRHQFLMSILPDLEKMSDRQMRKFRTRVSTAIEEILEDD